MTSTILTADGSYTWYSDFGMEQVDSHGHKDEDLNLPPLVMEQDAGESHNFVECKSPGGTLVCRIQPDGGMLCQAEIVTDNVASQTGTFQDTVSLTGDSVLKFKPQDGNGNAIADRKYNFGRSEDIGDFSHEGDGLQFWGKFQKNGVDEECAVQIGILPQEPGISINGFKNSGENYLQIEDEDGGLIFAVNNEGHIIGSYVVDPSNAGDTFHGSSVHNATSVYVGPARISHNDSKLRFYTLKTSHIPTFLSAAPYNVSAIPAEVM